MAREKTGRGRRGVEWHAKLAAEFKDHLLLEVSAQP